MGDFFASAAHIGTLNSEITAQNNAIRQGLPRNLVLPLNMLTIPLVIQLFSIVRIFQATSY